jgi:hypothetical protein
LVQQKLPQIQQFGEETRSLRSKHSIADISTKSKYGDALASLISRDDLKLRNA